MARGVQGGGCVIVHVGSRRLIPKQEPPKDDLGGKRKAVFVAVCRVKAVGQTVQGIPTGDFGLSGFGGASIRYQPMVGWRKIMTPCNVRACISVLRGLGDWSRRSRICPSPGASLHPDRSSRRCVRLFAESVQLSDHVGETFGIPSTSLTIPSVLHPEGLRFPGVLLGCFAH